MSFSQIIRPIINFAPWATLARTFSHTVTELRSSHYTIRKILDAAQKAGVSWPLPENITNKMLMELLYPEEYQKTALYALPDYPYIHTALPGRA